MCIKIMHETIASLNECGVYFYAFLFDNVFHCVFLLTWVILDAFINPRHVDFNGASG